MALLQDILSQLGQMGLGTSTLGGIAGFDPSAISKGLSQTYDISEKDLPSSLFQGISAGTLEGGMAKTFSPMIEATGESLLGKLTQQVGGKAGRQAFGGFAGSGQQGAFTQQAKDVYGKGMTDVLGQVSQQRTQGLQSIQDMINQWRETALRIKG